MAVKHPVGPKKRVWLGDGLRLAARLPTGQPLGWEVTRGAGVARRGRDQVTNKGSHPSMHIALSWGGRATPPSQLWGQH